jgi:hypothetical protein
VNCLLGYVNNPVFYKEPQIFNNFLIIEALAAKRGQLHLCSIYSRYEIKSSASFDIKKTHIPSK